MNSRAEFIYATCQVGADAILKREVAREWPTFKLAYSRPGFLTFKVSPDADLAAGFDLRCVFARAYGLSLGRAQGASASERAVYSAMLARQSLPGKVRLEIFEREKDDPYRRHEEECAQSAEPELAREVEAAMRAAQEDFFLPAGPPSEGDVVLTVVLVEEDEWWLGYHLHSRYHRPWPGGIARIGLPPEAPSRAYLKLREGLVWPGLPVREGETAVELGAAPGGATFGLLEQGLAVIGVDPADMAPAVARHPRFRHIRLQARQLRGSDVGHADWLLADMNIAPEETLEAVAKLLGELGVGNVNGALLTLKLGNWTRPDEVPELVRRLMEKLLHVGFARVQAAHLFYNRREVCVACFTPRGEARYFPQAKKSPETGAKARRSGS